MRLWCSLNITNPSLLSLSFPTLFSSSTSPSPYLSAEVAVPKPKGESNYPIWEEATELAFERRCLLGDPNRQPHLPDWARSLLQLISTPNAELLINNMIQQRPDLLHMLPGDKQCQFSYTAEDLFLWILLVHNKSSHHINDMDIFCIFRMDRSGKIPLWTRAE